MTERACAIAAASRCHRASDRAADVDDHTVRSVIDIAFALLQAGARVMVASGDGPLVSELQGFGGEWISL